MLEDRSKTVFITREGADLDVILTKPDKSIGCLLVYPCIGGDTQNYQVPIDTIVEKGFAVIEYHPPNHGRSTGQMAMETALHNLYHYMSSKRLSRLPIVALGHSAGCNALLQVNRSFLNITKYFFVQPVFDFRESMFYMYQKGTFNEFIFAISKWVNDVGVLQNLLSTIKWLNAEYWFLNDVCEQINKISNNFKLGSFLENFYIPGFNTYDLFRSLGGNATVILSTHDNWYPPDTTLRLCRETDTPYHIVDESPDHYFTNTWPHVWDIILKRF